MLTVPLRMYRLAVHAILAVLILVALSACAPRIDQIGTAHIAVVSVIPWDKVKNDLQPNFDIDTDKALNEIKESTSQFSNSVQQTEINIGVGASAGGSNEPGDQSDQAGAGAGGSREGSILPTDALKRSEVKTNPMMRYWAATALYQEVKLLNHFIESAFDEEAYRAYVVRIQISVMPNGRYQPYDVFSTLSFIPAYYPKAEPALSHACDTGSRIHRDLAYLSPSKAYAKENRKHFLQDNSRTGPTKLDTLRWMPKVIPLLVTDNVEQAIRANSVDMLARIALAAKLSGETQSELDAFHRELIETLGRDENSLLTVARMSENTIRVRIGAQYQVGLGGLFSSNRSMVPRTHYVSVLLLIPKYVKMWNDSDPNAAGPAKFINLVWGNDFVDENGRYAELPQLYQHDFAPYLDEMRERIRVWLTDRKKWTPFVTPIVDVFTDLVHPVSDAFVGPWGETKHLIEIGKAWLADDFNTFKDRLECYYNDYAEKCSFRKDVNENGQRETRKVSDLSNEEVLPRHCHDDYTVNDPYWDARVIAIWNDLAVLRRKFPSGVTRFEVPAPKPTSKKKESKLLYNNQLVLIEDDKTISRAILYGGQGFSQEEDLCAALIPSKQGNTGPNIVFAKKVEVIDSGQELRITFPSLVALRVAATKSNKQDPVTGSEGSESPATQPNSKGLGKGAKALEDGVNETQEENWKLLIVKCEKLNEYLDETGNLKGGTGSTSGAVYKSVKYVCRDKPFEQKQVSSNPKIDRGEFEKVAKEIFGGGQGKLELVIPGEDGKSIMRLEIVEENNKEAKEINGSENK